MQSEISKSDKSGYAAVNGLKYYYAIYGTGEPLLLLHGGLGDVDAAKAPHTWPSSSHLGENAWS